VARRIDVTPSRQDRIAITAGILAGGRATRLGGHDKAWLRRDGQPQVLRLMRSFRGQVDGWLVSANVGLDRYAAHGLRAVPDHARHIGPMGGLDALLRACPTDWLLTVPVDVIDVDDGLLPTLRMHAADVGARAADDDGVQPLVALWNVGQALPVVSAAIAMQAFGVHGVQDTLGMPTVRFNGLRFGNLNTPADLATARVDMPA
jgi:molybdopterin-guanine dinucleotide biosynthesis protein A